MSWTKLRAYNLVLILFVSAACSADFGFGTGDLSIEESCKESQATAVGLKVEPHLVFLVPGQNVLIREDVIDAKGNSVDCVFEEGSVSDTTVVSLIGSANVTAKKDGVAILRVKAMSFADSAIINVSSVAIGAVWITLPSTMTVGQTATASMTIEDSKGNAVQNLPVYYSSSDTSKATVSAAGVVKALAEGTVDITAIVNNVSGSWRVRIDR